MFRYIFTFLLVLPTFIFAQPSNDECSGAINVSPTQECSTPVQGDLNSATKTTLSTTNNYYDIWYSFVASTTTHYILVTGDASSNFKAAVQLFTGSCGTLSQFSAPVTSTSTSMSVTYTGLTIGQTYYYRIYHNATNTYPNNTSITTCVEKFILNDDCSGAITLASSELCKSTRGKTSGATQSQVGCSGNADDDVWYTFQATNPTHFIDVQGSTEFNTVIEAFSGTCGSLASLKCENSTAKGGLESLKLTGLTIGDWYLIRVYENTAGSSTTPYFDICVTNPPFNDDCANATSVKVGSSCSPVSGNGTYATQSLTTTLGTANDDLWYKFVADTTVEYISVTSSTYYDPVVQVFKDCSTPLPAPNIFLDDTSYPVNGFGTSKVSGLTKGDTYYYRVYDKSSTNPLSMGFSTCVVNPVKNDECNTATTITPGYTCISTNGDGTYASQSQAANCTGTANDDVWYKFTATNDIHFINVDASFQYDPVVEIFSACGTKLTPTFCNDTDFGKGTLGSKSVSGLNPGSTYYYRIYDKSSTNPATMTFKTCVTTPPSNDDCSGAVEIFADVTCNSASGNGTYATQTSAGCSGTANDDVWYKFTATGTSNFIAVTPDDQDYDPVVEVYTACGSKLTPTFCEATKYNKGKFGTAEVKGLTSGSTYFYRVYDKSSTNPDTMSFNTCVVNKTPNDDCADAINVPTGSTCTPVIGDGTFATQSLSGCKGTANDDVWFKFTATNTTQFISVTPDDSKYDPVVEVYSACGTKLNPTFCEDVLYAKGKFGTAPLNNLTIGNIYYYRVYDYNSTNQDTMTFTTCVVDPVANDECLNAINVTPGNSCSPVIGDGTYATQSLNGCNGTANDDVWFKFTATTTNEFITVDAPLGYDPVIQLFSACGTALSPAICEDNLYPKSSFGTKSIPTIIGNTYFYRVYDRSSTNTFPMAFSTCVVHSPINDECAGAITVTSGSSCNSVDGDGTYATLSTGTSTSCGGTANDDVWYKFVATNTSQNIYVTSSSDYDPVVQLYSSCGATPTPFPAAATSCNDVRYPKDGQGSNTFTGLAVGNTYYYRVYDKGSTTPSPMTFTTCVTDPPLPPINDEPCNAILITPTTSCGYLTYSNEAATNSSGITAPGCANYQGGDVWFKVKVPFSGQLTFEMKPMAIQSGGMALYKGSCNSLSLYKCNYNSSSNGNVPKISETGLNPGDTLWVRVWEYGNDNNGTFGLCVTKGPEASLVGPCTNLDFENGLTGWFGTTGKVLEGAATDPTPIYNPTKLDATLPTPTTNEFDLMSNGLDPLGGFPMVYQGSKSLRLGYKTSSNDGRSIEQYFKVTKDNSNFQYNYAVVLNDGNSSGSPHGDNQQPLFKAEFFDDDGNQISCGDYLVTAPKTGQQDKIGLLQSVIDQDVYYKTWTTVNVDLTPYIGQNVHVRFTTGTCSYNAHYGYVYLDCSCSPYELIAPSSICVGDTGILYAPKGALSYLWKNESGVSLATSDSLIVKESVAGTYRYSCEITRMGTNLCTTVLDTVVVVKATPTLTITDPAPVCAPSTVDITQSSITAGSTPNLTLTYWRENTLINPLIKQSAVDSTKTFYIKGARTATCFDIQPVNITINPIPVIADKTETICSGDSFTITPADVLPDKVPAGTQYTWTVVDNSNVTGESNQSTSQNTISQTLINTSNTAQNVVYTVTPISGTCTGSSFTVTVTVNPKPNITDKTTTICSNSTFTISPTNSSPDIVPSGTKYTWTVIDNPNTTGEVNETNPQTNITSVTNLVNNTSTTQNVVYTVSPTSGTCVGSNFNTTVTINPLPKIADYTADICTGTSFDATPTDNAPTTIVPTGTIYSWTAPTLSTAGSITGSSAQSNQTLISQTITNTSTADATASYTVTATTNTTPTCSSTFKADITIKVKVKPTITCGTSTANSIQFDWTNIPGVSYSYVYKNGVSGALSAPAALPSGSTSQVINGLSPGNTVYFTLTPVGTLCPLDATKSCANCVQPTLTNNSGTPTDFEICVGEEINIKSTDVPTNNTQWDIVDPTIISGIVQTPKDEFKIKGLLAGSTDINFTNDAGCVATVTIVVKALPTATNISGGNNYCIGASKNDILVDVTGEPNWTINYTLDGNALSKSGSTSPISLGNATGVYVLTNISDNVCTNTASGTQTITENPLPSVTLINGGNTYCQGDVLSNIETTVTGSPNWTVTYTLDGVNQSASGSSSPIALGNNPGEYILTGITDNNCTNSAVGNQKITVLPLPTVTAISGGNTYCSNDTPKDIVVDVTGVPNWTINYTIDGNPFTSSGSTSPITLNNIAGVYVLTGITDNQCTNTAIGTESILLTSLPTVTNVYGANTYCQGDVINPILVDVTGTPNWTIDYTLDGVSNQASGNSSPITLGNSEGVYIVTSIKDNNCSNTASGTQTIVINSLPTVSSSSGGGIYCAGDVIGDVTANVTGTANWSITYTLDGISNSATGSSSPISLGNAKGTYVLNAITDLNCTNTVNETQTITINSLPTVTLVNGGNTYCQGDVLANITTDVTGVPNWSVNYTLDGVAKTATGSTSPISIDNLPGVYIITGISDNNCTNSAVGNQTITVNPLPTVSNMDGGDTYCFGDVVNPILADVTGTKDWTINYTLDGSPNSVTSSTTPVSLGNLEGIYIITQVTDANCTNTSNLKDTILINPLPTLTSISGGKTYCQGDVINPIEVSVTGTPNYTITYTLDGVSKTKTSISSPFSLGNSIGKYILSSLSDKNCTSNITGQDEIVINPLPQFALTPVTVCENENTELKANFQNAQNYNWTGPNSFTSNAENPQFTSVSVNQSGTYMLEITDVNSCKNTKNVVLTINPLPIVNAGKDQEICFGKSTLLSGSGAVSYQWDNNVLNKIKFTPSSTTTYTVIGTDNKQCSNTDEVTITVKPLPIPDFDGTKEICIDDTLKLINLTTPSNSSIVWEYGDGKVDTNVFHTYLFGGKFDVTLTATLDGCVDSITKKLFVEVVNKPTNVNFTMSENTIDFYLPEISFSPTTDALFYHWDFGDGKTSTKKYPTHTFPEEPGSYMVRLTASNLLNSCSNYMDQVITMPEPVIYFIPNTFTPNGDEVNNTFQPIFTFGYDPSHYSFFIFNRWGELIFESHDPKIGWDGTYGDKLLKGDTFIWKLQFKEKQSDKEHNETGHVNLIR